MSVGLLITSCVNCAVSGYVVGLLTRDGQRAKEFDKACAILRRNLGLLRNDHTPTPEQSRQDYLDACRLCGVEPEDYSGKVE